MTVLTAILGVGILVLVLKALPLEQDARAERNRALLHVRFQSLENPDICCDLNCSQYILGRRKRRSDLNLDQLGDRSISRLHAELWFDGVSYCLTPFPRPGEPRHPTTTYVNDQPVDLEGVALEYGDHIRLGNSSFTLINTDTEGGDYV